MLTFGGPGELKFDSIHDIKFGMDVAFYYRSRLLHPFRLDKDGHPACYMEGWGGMAVGHACNGALLEVRDENGRLWTVWPKDIVAVYPGIS